MDFNNLLEHTLLAGAYKAKIIPTSDLAFNPDFVQYCQENTCGKYGTNYSCPPLCGTPDSLIAKACNYQYALVISNVSTVNDPCSSEGIAFAKHENDTIIEQMRRFFVSKRIPYMMARANYCDYCKVCAAVNDKPCIHPDIASISLSAFCVDLTHLATTCDMAFNHGDNTLTLFSIIFFQGSSGWNAHL